MKKLLLLLFVLVAACQEEEFNANTPSVDQFVRLLQAGQYDRS
ncbi:hypothetical protein [Tunicatimonas pelagia]|nr:hypothetical protein [Tunicatimonas pelagia]WKN44061.1 hypothetical protein P0M28_03645 [Tunicatimonas pelagia]